MIGSRTKRSAALVAGGALLWLAPISASALGISIVNVSSSGGNTAYLSNNDILTLDLVVENATNEDVYGLGLGIAGYDIGNDGNVNNDALRFIGGSVAISALNTSLETDPELVGIGGLENVRTTATELGAGPPFSNPRRVVLFEGVALSPSNGDGSLDVGIGGGTVGSGDVHFRVSFRAVTALNPRNVTLRIGVGDFGNVAVGAGGVELPFSNASFTVNVVPEPGTALLMGLGLAGLAARGRR